MFRMSPSVVRGTLLVIQMSEQILDFGVANTIGSWAVGVAVLESGALALRDFNEGLVAHIHAVDFDAAAMLPGVPNLQVAQP